MSAAPQPHAQAAMSDEQIATMWLTSQDQAVSGQPAPIHFARAILASQQPAAAPRDEKPFAYFVQPSSFGPFIECESAQAGSFPAYRAGQGDAVKPYTEDHMIGARQQGRAAGIEEAATWLTGSGRTIAAAAIRALAASQSPAATPLQKMTMSYVQNVPEQCDRITWRGSYYHLKEGKQPAAAPAIQQEGAALDALNALHTHMQNNGYYRTDDTLPLFRQVVSALTAPLQPQPAALQETKPYGWLTGIGGDVTEDVARDYDYAKRECDERNAYERSRDDFDPAEHVDRVPVPLYDTPQIIAQPAALADAARSKKP